MNRRKFVALAGALACGALTKANASQSTPLTLVVPFPPGGGGDTLARAVCEKFGANLGRKVVVLNRPGAGGNIGTRSVVASASCDVIGYVTNGIYCVNEHLYEAQKFSPATDLQPIGRICSVDLMMVINPAALPGVGDWESFREYVRSNPGRVNFASAGVGTTSHLAAILLNETQGLKTVHIPHAGGAAARMEVVAGRVPFMIDVAAGLVPLVKAGKLKAIAVCSDKRIDAAPEVPTFVELGVPEMILGAWDGFAASNAMPQAELDRMNAALQKALADTEVLARLARMGAVAKPAGRDDFQKFIAKERIKWGRLAALAKKND